MTVKMILGAFLILAGAVSAFLGLMFIIASGEKGSRLAAGSALLGGGLVAAVYGLRLFRLALKFSSRGIEKQILTLAKMNHGELTGEAVTGSIGEMDEIGYKLTELVRNGVAREEVRDGRKVYMFPDFQLKVVQKKCPYCGSDYPLRDAVEFCPNCGGDLKLSKTLLSNSGKYSMDEDI